MITSRTASLVSITMVVVSAGCRDAATTPISPEAPLASASADQGWQFVPVVMDDLDYDYMAPSGVNNRREVVGVLGTQDGTRIRGFLWTADAGTTELDCLPGDSYCQAIGINEQGAISGWSRSADGYYRAVRWNAAGGIEDLLPDSEGPSHAMGINNRGTIAGYSSIPTPDEAGTFTVRSWVWSRRGGTRYLPIEESSQAYTVNDRGVVVGWMPSGDAFSWSETSGLRELRRPAGTLQAEATGVNNHGWVVGTAGAQAILWRNRSRPEILLPDRSASAAGISEYDEIVGTIWERTQKAYRWTRWDGLQIVGAGYASAINARGDIAGASILGPTLWRKVPAAREEPVWSLAAAPEAAPRAEQVARWSRELELLTAGREGARRRPTIR
jgi:uncharacterized membrane protein